MMYTEFATIPHVTAMTHMTLPAGGKIPRDTSGTKPPLWVEHHAQQPVQCSLTRTRVLHNHS
jgi:hypothetical protein